MPFLRYLLLPVSLGPILLLMGAMTRETAPPSPSAAPPAPLPVAADATATRTFEQMLALLGPNRVSWMDLKLWQRVNVQGLSYETEGHFLTGPDERMRLDLSTRLGETVSEARVVCDGKTLWHAKRVAGGAWNPITKVELPEVHKALNRPGVNTKITDALVRQHSFGGVYPLLAGLRQQMRWVRREEVRRGEREFIKLTGVWDDAVALAFTPDGQAWPQGLARQCRLYLDPRTFWPCRIEWWGPDAPRYGEVPLLQMEFREPRLNDALSPEQCARAFHFNPNGAEVTDVTQVVAEQLVQRKHELDTK
jgi:hypothetical protein